MKGYGTPPYVPPVYPTAVRVIQAADISAPAAYAVMGNMSASIIPIIEAARIAWWFDVTMFDAAVVVARTPRFRARLDGVVEPSMPRGATSNVGGVIHAFAMSGVTASVAPGVAHTIDIEWQDSVGAGGPSICWPSSPPMGAALWIMCVP